jgi:Ca-activated chloride channel family protein
MTTTTEMAPRIGLWGAQETDRISLRGVRVRARVAGMSLKATVEQTFVNLEAQAIEAVYTFPLPEGAAVCGFEVVFFDKVLTGVVEETDRAIRQYDDAIAEGDGAYLLEQHRPDVFSVRVGNLKPRQAVTIRVSYVSDLTAVDRSIRLAFPTTIAPRYTTASGMDPLDAAIEGDALNPPYVLSVPYGLSMEVEIDLGKGLTGVTSPSHHVLLSRGDVGGTWIVGFAGDVAEMDRDVVLELAMAREQEPFALAAASAAGERFIAVNFLPEFEEEVAEGSPAAARETVFLLDCSGSMTGQPTEQATAALECCLRCMSAGDSFNVCRFGSRFELLSPKSLIYSAKTLKQATLFINQRADLGGTELFAPLEAILQQRPAVGDVRNIVLLTDGQVTNEPAVIALARRARAHNRIFTFGIGAASSAFLVNGLARVTGGAAEFIAPGERIEEKVLRAFGRLASPPVSDVEIDWGDADAQVAPRFLPPLFDGDALRVFARLPGRVPATVTLRCNTAAGPRTWTVPVCHGADPAQVLPTLWARSMIRTIEEEDGVQQTASISAPSVDRAKLVELSKRYGLLCGLTSFVAVEHRSLEDRNEGRPALRRVPVLLAAEWGGVAPAQAMIAGAAAAFACGVPAATPAMGGGGPAFGLAMRRRQSSATPPPPASPAPAQLHEVARTLDRTIDKTTIDRFMDSLDRSADRSYDKASAPSVPPTTPRLINLLAHQMADGSFDSSAAVDHVVGAAGLDRAKLQTALEHMLHKAHVPSGARPKIRQTLVVLMVLTRAFADRKDIWTRAFKKAMRFVTSEGQLLPGMAQEWLDELSAKFQSSAQIP